MLGAMPEFFFLGEPSRRHEKSIYTDAIADLLVCATLDCNKQPYTVEDSNMSDSLDQWIELEGQLRRDGLLGGMYTDVNYCNVYVLIKHTVTQLKIVEYLREDELVMLS